VGPGLPAPGLSGGPTPIGLSAERRDALFADLDALWKEKGAAFLKSTLRRGDGTNAAGFRLFHVFIDEDPAKHSCEGWMVRTDGKETLRVGIERSGRGWRLDTTDRQGCQIRLGAATDADRDGDLFR
jgi:hypothetical protein